MNKPVYLDLSILDISKIARYDYIFWYGFIACIKTEDIYKYINGNVNKKYDTSNREIDRPLTRNKKKK